VRVEPQACDVVRRAIHMWPESAGFDPVCDGFDYCEGTAFFLWDKVAAAARAGKLGADYAGELSPTSFWSGRDSFDGRPAGPYMAGLKPRFRSRMRLYRRAVGGSVRSLYVPLPEGQLHSSLDALSQASDLDFTVLLPADSSAYPRHGFGRVLCRGMHIRGSDRALAGRLVKPISAGLQSEGLHLSESAIALLSRQIAWLSAHIRYARRELSLVKPTAILVPTDNNPPCHTYVQLARSMGVTSVVLQHGLDCEVSCLEDLHADHALVWSENRRQRYAAHGIAPERITVIGHPRYRTDRTPTPRRLQQAASWLWVTRPHRIDKCYSPRRDPQEGGDILSSLLDALRQFPECELRIKPHPCDDVAVYLEQLRCSDVGDRAEIVSGDPLDLVKSCSLVVAEDSTAAMDCMFGGVPMVHVHFCEDRPVLPLVAYGAALPGFSSSQLGESLASIIRNQVDLTRMGEGQQRFVREYAGTADGRYEERVVSALKKLVAA
jgi:hypothetical protein